MIKRWLHGMRLSLVLSLVVLVIFMITGTIVVGIAFIAMHVGWMDKLGLKRTFPIIAAVVPASAIVGTLVTLIFGRIPLRPVREIIDATNRLAAGDFSVRLSFRHRPEFRALRESFNRMAEELNSIELLRGDFVNNFSHEFKTPINAIEGYTTLLQDRQQSPEDQQECIEKILFNTKRLTELVSNILLISKVESQVIQVEKKSYRLDEQIRQAILSLEKKWSEKNIEFDVDMEPVAYLGNEGLMFHVWTNLIDNAVKFDPFGGNIRIRLQTHSEHILFEIEDNGLGISEAEQKHIYDKFYQADNPHKAEGNGLGLALVKRILDTCGGDIQVQSAPDCGCRFMISLPAS